MNVFCNGYPGYQGGATIAPVNTGVDAPLASAPQPLLRKAPDVWTISAIAIVAYVIADVIHEGIGHGGMCILTGGHPLALSSVYFQCEREGRLVAAGGTLANLAGAFFSWIASRFVVRSTRLRYFLWLLMTVNLLECGGYFLFSGVANIGDWAAVIQGLQPPWLWRIALTLVGVAAYLVCVWIALLEMRPFLGVEWPERLRRARRLTWTPYLTGGILMCIAGLFNPVGMILVAISAAAASFGGTSGFAWMGMLLRGPRIPTSALQMPPLTRSWGWIISGGVLAVLFIAILGPGLKFH